MPVEVFHGAGIDVHKETAVVTIRHQGPDQVTPSRQETRTFRTLTDDLPLYNLLETTCVVWLVNPAHVKALRGRKTDVKDSQWLAELLTRRLPANNFRGRPTNTEEIKIRTDAQPDQ